MPAAQLDLVTTREGETSPRDESGGRRPRWTGPRWSFEGGGRPAAIAVLVLRGELPRPARVVMTDTSREASATWAYLEGVVQPALT